MKTLFQILTALAFVSAATYGVLRFIDRVYAQMGTKYVEFPCHDEEET